MENYKNILKLNLPEFEYSIKKQNNKLYIRDILKGHYLVLTPEEWVRQHFLNYLVETGHTPKKLIRTERVLQYNKMAKRPDILVYSRSGLPMLVVECKAPFVSLGNRTVMQLGTYNSQLGAEFLAITNGLVHFYWQKDKEGFRLLNQLPDYEKMNRITEGSARSDT